ncbi:hypothetical protein Taro_051996 [Colocasia esculenta]|uniref:Uncharacterized protein n=1 Tax=Colocasia esculenta TaxID=4460 RepID=A0A843XI23_COLES|nr:hypothetical protein [Colocasia esculenta]
MPWPNHEHPLGEPCLKDSPDSPKRWTSLKHELFALQPQVDTESSQVDTRDLSQRFDLPVWESVSTHLMGRSTHSGISVT